jgi:pullulanase/glycogen debranching enzyme
MKSVVVDPSSYDWEGDGPLRRPIASTVIYGTHVAGFTRHPSSSVASELRGTYSAGARGPIPHPATLRRCAGFANRRRSRSRERPRGNKCHDSH